MSLNVCAQLRLNSNLFRYKNNPEAWTFGFNKKTSKFSMIFKRLFSILIFKNQNWVKPLKHQKKLRLQENILYFECVIRNLLFAYAKIKVRISSAVTEQPLYFCYIDSLIPPLSNIWNVQPLGVFCGSTAWFVSDLDKFSHEAASF